MYSACDLNDMPEQLCDDLIFRISMRIETRCERSASRRKIFMAATGLEQFQQPR